MKGRSFWGTSSLIFMGEPLHFIFKIKTCVLDVVKGEKVKPVFEEPPNPTNVEVSLQQMKANDPSLQEVNLNNIKVFHYDCCPLRSENLLEMTDCLFYTCLKFCVLTGFWGTISYLKEMGFKKRVIPRILWKESQYLCYTQCISYLLLSNKLLQNNKQLLFHIISECQESGSDWTGLLWLRVSNEAIVKLSARAALVWRLDEGTEIHFQGGAVMWLLAGGLSFSERGSLNRAAWVSSHHDNWLPPEQVIQKKKRETKLEATVPFMTYSLKSYIVTSALTISHVTLKGRVRCVCVCEREREHCLTSFLLILFGPISSI